MPVNPQLSVIRTTTKTATITMRAISMLLVMLMPMGLFMLAPQTAAASTELYSAADNELNDLLHTETVLIAALTSYIDTLQQKIDVIKSKTLQIKAINEIALKDTEKFVNNPLNSVKLMKRFTSDWNALRAFARNNESTTAIVDNISAARDSLTFPSEADFDEAAGNLLRIQEVYQLEPQRLAVGEVNGVKLGSEMSWSDCLEIGRKSVQNGDYTIAKFWMETALGKLPADNGAPNATQQLATAATIGAAPNSETQKARFEILELLLNVEFHAGNIEKASEIVDKMMEHNPTHKGVLKAKKEIDNEMKKKITNERQNGKLNDKHKKKKKQKKSTEEQLIQEICRAATNANTHTNAYTNTNSNAKYCSLVYGNLPQLRLQQLKVEYLSLDPYIVLHHDVLSVRQIAELRNLLEEDASSTNEDAVNVQFTNLAKKKLARIAQQLEEVTGHAGERYEPWRAERWSFEDDNEFEALVPKSARNIANVMFNLQTPKLGGAIAFPQLELSVDVPHGALLYWSNLNEFFDYDYRTKQYVCPIIAGTQITALSSIRRS